MAPRDSLSLKKKPSKPTVDDQNRRPSASEVLTRTLFAVKAGGDARRSGPMTEEDLECLKEEHVAYSKQLQACRERIKKLAKDMRKLRRKLEKQIQQAEEEKKKGWKKLDG